MTDALAFPEDDAALLERAGVAELPPAEQGLFRAESWLRRVSGEPVVLLGGGRALLMEVAHPLVAQGVADHSSFRTDPFGRLQRTLDAMTAITFGDRAAALAAARGVERAHRRVRGRLRERGGRFPAGTPYSGRDPELVLWVWATLVDSAVAVYERFVAPLPPGARAAYHAEQGVMARLLGVPAERVPRTPADFDAYVAGMLESDALAVTGTGAEIAESVLSPPPGLVSRRQVRAITTVLLPERLRREFGLVLDEGMAGEVDALAASVRALRRPAAAVDAGPERG